ncbi:MAG TPA: response regulator transcription factor [Vicinamibacterales bacterium]|nr:response regulator transcription factor [Vicinamibacterales bacterium]
MTPHKRILVVEDDPIFRSILEGQLGFEGYQVQAVGTGQAALTMLRTSKPDLLILDLTLPDRDGLELCATFQRISPIPIIILSARSQKADKVKGLDLGAQDYITKPVDLDELLARIRVVLRRTETTAVHHLTVGRLVIDFQRQTARAGRRAVTLTTQEFKILRYLAERQGQVVHRDELMAEVWGCVTPAFPTRSVDQAIFRLRRKIERDAHQPVFIRTAHRDGYCLSTGY